MQGVKGSKGYKRYYGPDHANPGRILIQDENSRKISVKASPNLAAKLERELDEAINRRADQN